MVAIYDYVVFAKITMHAYVCTYYKYDCIGKSVYCMHFAIVSTIAIVTQERLFMHSKEALHVS